MRQSRIVRLLFLTTLTASIGVWAACGDDPVAPIPSVDSGRDSGSGNDEDSGDNGPGDASGNPTDANKPDVITYDAGDKVFLDGGLDGGGLECYVGSEVEEEPNDTLLLANQLHRPDSGAHPGRCGLVLVSDGGADGGEEDWLKFQLSSADAGTKTFFVYYEGKVKATVETDGMAPTEISTSPSPSLLFARGQDYYVRVRSATGSTETWKIVLFEQ